MPSDEPVVEQGQRSPANNETIATPNDANPGNAQPLPSANPNAVDKPQSPAPFERKIPDYIARPNQGISPTPNAENKGSPNAADRSIAVDKPDSSTTTPPVRPSGRSSDAEVIASIDRAIRQRWSAATITPSARATESEWLRRVFLSVVGRIPKLEEVEAFLADRSPKKREVVVDQLLTSTQYADELARNLTNVYTEALLGHTAGDLATDKTNRAGMQQYLRRSFLENKSYDKLTTELLTASGSTNPDAEDFNGATNFLADKLDASGVQATVKTTEIFLGEQVQ
jgi:hypothetical protein